MELDSCSCWMCSVKAGSEICLSLLRFRKMTLAKILDIRNALSKFKHNEGSRVQSCFSMNHTLVSVLLGSRVSANCSSSFHLLRIRSFVPQTNLEKFVLG